MIRTSIVVHYLVLIKGAFQRLVINLNYTVVVNEHVIELRMKLSEAIAVIIEALGKRMDFV